MNDFINDKDNFIQKCEDSGKFNWKQIDEMRKSIEHNLSIEQVKLYVNPKFNSYQMSEIREDLEYGLTMEEVKLYANPKFNVEQMIKIRKLIL